MKTTLTPIASAVTLALFGAMLPAHAQQAAAAAPAAGASAPAAQPEVQRVEVTGIRASLDTSLKQKRNADGVMEVITAEDVGKMPDKNVADSLQRLPGVYTATAGGTEGGFGENDRVSVRGAPASLTLTTLNGHTVSTGDWYSLNIQSGGRSVSYTLLPSEIIGSVNVYKSSQASVVEGGAAGTVDIITRKPLDFTKEFSFTGSVEGVYSTLAGKTDPQLYGLFNWKNEQSNFGVMVEGFYEKRHLRRDGQEFLWWDTINDLWGGNQAVLAAHPDLSGKYISGLTGSALFEQERKREGGLVDVQFKPSADVTLDLNGFYSRLDAVNENHNWMYDPFNAITNGISPSAYTITGNTVTSLTFDGSCPPTDPYQCRGVSSGVQDIAVRPGARSSSSYIDFDAAWKMSDTMSFTSMLGQTQGEGTTKDIGFEVWGPYYGGSYTTHGLNGVADVTVPHADTYAVGGVSCNLATGACSIGGWASLTDAKDKETYGQIDGTWKTGMESVPRLKFGFRAADHSRTLTDVPGTLSAAGQDPANVPTDALTHYPSDFASDLGGDMLRGAWTIPGSAITDWADQYMTFSGHTPQSEFKIKEPTTSLYSMGELSGESLRGNFGVRLVNTKEEVTNNILDSNTGLYVPTTITNNYFDVLPSANIVLDLSKNVVNRFAVSRTMSRPDFGQLGGLTLMDVQLTGTGGNPNLKPVRSTNFDYDVEWYFAPKSMFSAGVYYMNFDSYVTYGSFDATFYNQSQKQYTVYSMSAPVNTTAELKGIELNYIQALGYGFGVNANYTFADGRETGKAPNSACANTGDCHMIGNSKNAYNLGAYYENDLFSARVNYSYRSSFLNGLDRHSAIYQDGVGTVGLSLNYNVTKNVALTFEGKDLNNPVLKSYATTPDQPRAFYTNGAQYYFGVRGNF
jgi:iron complex outermembrane receptor protein